MNNDLDIIAVTLGVFDLLNDLLKCHLGLRKIATHGIEPDQYAAFGVDYRASRVNHYAGEVGHISQIWHSGLKSSSLPRQ